MPIKRHNDHANNLTTFTVTGTVSLPELFDVAKTFKADPPAQKVLWDFSAAGPDDSFSSIEIDKLASLVKSGLGLRPGGKTAYVATSDSAFGLIRMYTAHLVYHDIIHEIEVFRSMNDALQWLSVGAK